MKNQRMRPVMEEYLDNNSSTTTGSRHYDSQDNVMNEY
jgi:hypothetical protein